MPWQPNSPLTSLSTHASHTYMSVKHLPRASCIRFSGYKQILSLSYDCLDCHSIVTCWIHVQHSQWWCEIQVNQWIAVCLTWSDINNPKNVSTTELNRTLHRISMLPNTKTLMLLATFSTSPVQKGTTSAPTTQDPDQGAAPGADNRLVWGPVLTRGYALAGQSHPGSNFIILTRDSYALLSLDMHWHDCIRESYAVELSHLSRWP